jgi:hypothetical protein
MKKRLLAVLTVSFLVLGAFGVTAGSAGPITLNQELPNEY